MRNNGPVLFPGSNPNSPFSGGMPGGMPQGVPLQRSASGLLLPQTLAQLEKTVRLTEIKRNGRRILAEFEGHLFLVHYMDKLPLPTKEEFEAVERPIFTGMPSFWDDETLVPMYLVPLVAQDRSEDHPIDSEPEPQKTTEASGILLDVGHKK